MSNNFSSLAGKMLIAMPYAMEGSVFHESMIYVIQHTKEGAIGLIFNRSIKNIPSDELSKKIQTSLTLPEIDMEVHIGGPVEVERGFFLHSMDYNKNLLYKSADGQLGVTSNTDIVADINDGKGPKNAVFILGYTGWGEGQLEFEIENNLWIITEADKEIIFADNLPIKWTAALATIGINVNEFVPHIGNC